MAWAEIAKVAAEVAKEGAKEGAKETAKQTAKEVGKSAKALEVRKPAEASGPKVDILKPIDGLNKQINLDKRIPRDEYKKKSGITEVNGYKYTTDKLGRTVSAEGDLKLKPETKRNQKLQSEAGGKDRLKTDDGGHPIGRQFGGEGKLDLVAQDSILNRGPYNRLESKWADALRNGDKVSVKVDMRYPGNSMRPDSFRVKYSINGEKFKANFSNKPNAYAR